LLLGAALDPRGGVTNTKLVSSIDAVARSPLVTISGDTLLVDAARPLSDTHISLAVVCDYDGVMVGVVTKTDLVQRIGRCGETPARRQSLT